VRKHYLTIFLAMLFGPAIAQAQIKAFVISIKGTITQDDGTTIQVKDVEKGVSGLVSTNHILVLFISKNDNAIELDEVDPVATNIVRGILVSRRTALFESGKFKSDLIAYALAGSDAYFPAPIPPFNGGLIADGKVVLVGKPSIGAKLTGVWKDSGPLSGTETNTPAASFKGSLTSIRTNALPDNCCLTFSP
jgi:hypothetical protein